jgi:hypothetical protein
MGCTTSFQPIIINIWDYLGVKTRGGSDIKEDEVRLPFSEDSIAAMYLLFSGDPKSDGIFFPSIVRGKD